MNDGPRTARTESVTWPCVAFAPDVAATLGGVALIPSTCGSSWPPKRQAAITSAVTKRIAASATPTVRDSRRSRRWRRLGLGERGSRGWPPPSSPAT